MNELPIIQKTYDLIHWYVPIIERFPRVHRFTLGDRMMNGMYELLEELIIAQYSSRKLERLERLNPKLSVLRYQTRLSLEFGLMTKKRYEYASKLVNSIGADLGGWIKDRRKKEQRENAP